MSNVSKKIARSVVHVVADPRKFYYQKVANIAAKQHGKEILELGSGPLVKGKYYYSVKYLFDESNNFVQSDINKEFGHPIVDATTMKYANKFDLLLCLNVLEHIYDHQKALTNIYKALRKNGLLVVAVPFAYPLHDEPGDYWRFTEYTLKRILSAQGFRKISIAHKGKREFPFGYFVTAIK